MPATTIFRLVANQNAHWTALGRACALTASGPESPVPSEGFLVVPGDVSAINISVYDPTGPNPTTAIFSDNPAPASVIQTSLQTGNVWTAIVGGGNFEYTFTNNIFTLPAHDYLVVVKITSSGGVVSYGQANLHTQKVGP